MSARLMMQTCTNGTGKKPAVFGPMTDHQRPGLRDRKIRLGYTCVNFISSICGKIGPTAGIESLPRR